MQRFKTLFRKPEFHAFIACLILLIFSWPILTILEPTKNRFVFFYLFATWGLVIILLLLIAISHRKLGSEQSSKSETEV
jgi:Na+/melibiose symporter-like transporter